uniref:Uncharacterized protein n=1 Tax=Aegilops tauschii subsp. strangulata TaxID=200361 RepID=A0A453SHU4_AEGTS
MHSQCVRLRCTLVSVCLIPVLTNCNLDTSFFGAPQLIFLGLTWQTLIVLQTWQILSPSSSPTARVIWMWCQMLNKRLSKRNVSKLC